MTDVIKGKVLLKKALLSGKVRESSGGTSFYEMLIGKPQINGIELSGNKTSSELLLQSMMTPVSNEEIEEMFKQKG